MALTDEVQDRLSSQRLIELTNPQAPNATSIDSTRLARAATDAQALFGVHCGLAYDNTKAVHVAVAVDLVVSLLQKRMGKISEQAWEQVLEALKAAALVLGRDRIRPSTRAPYAPSAEQSSAGETVRPDTDRERFDDLRLGGPRSTRDRLDWNST